MKCTYRAAELLKEDQRLKVHSVYRHTVNIVVKGRILAFHRNTIPSTPLSLALPFTGEEFEHFEQEAKRTGQINMYISHENGRLFSPTETSYMSGRLFSATKTPYTFSSIETQQNEIVNFRETEEISAELSDRYCWISTGNFKQSAGKILLWEDRLDRQDKSNQLEKGNRLNELEKSGLESENQKLNSEKPESEIYLKKDFINQENKNMVEDILSVLLPILTRNSQLGGFSDCAVTTEKRKNDSFITQILREKTAAILSEDILADALENILKDTSKNINTLRDISENKSQNISENRSTKKDMSKDENVTEHKAISKNCETDFEKLISSLIGLGPGLTPSGDDFLTGILLAFLLHKNIRTYIKTDMETNIRTGSRACLKNHSCNLRTSIYGIFCLHSVAVARYAALIQAKSPTNCDAHLTESIFRTRSRKDTGTTADRERVATRTKKLDRKQQQICKVVSENLDRTNDISKEYLLCAMENRFGELYHKLQEELYHGNVPEDIFHRIIHTGHSSGLDTLNGLAVGLKMIRTIDLE